MRYRKLRIAWSVVWGVVAVLLVALWIRSYWVMDRTCVGWSGLPYNFVFTPLEGRLGVAIRDYDINPGNPTARLFCTRTRDVIGPDFVRLDLDSKGRLPGRRWFTILREAHQFEVLIPMWFPPLFSSGLAFGPWIEWSRRFTLRTLLIATTLVAVVLGVIA